MIQSKVLYARLGRQLRTNMSNKTPDKFSLHVPDEKEPARALPSKLEVIDYNPRTKQPQANLPAGAYNPYDRERSDGDRRKEKRKQVGPAPTVPMDTGHAEGQDPEDGRQG